MKKRLEDFTSKQLVKATYGIGDTYVSEEDKQLIKKLFELEKDKYSHSSIVIADIVKNKYTDVSSFDYPSQDKALDKTLENNKFPKLAIKTHINNKIRDAIAKGRYYTTMIFNFEDWVHEPGQEGTDRFIYNLRREMTYLYQDGYTVSYRLTDDFESYYCKVEWETQSIYDIENQIKEGKRKQKRYLPDSALQGNLNFRRF